MEYFPELVGREQLDTVADLMPLDMGLLYTKIEATDPERRMYGYIPMMAACSYGQIGALTCALNAESFCERVLSCANDVSSQQATPCWMIKRSRCW